MFLEFWQTEEIDYSTVFVFYFCFCTFVFVYMFLANRGDWLQASLGKLGLCLPWLYLYLCICILFVCFVFFSKQRRCWLQASLEKIGSLPPPGNREGWKPGWMHPSLPLKTEYNHPTTANRVFFCKIFGLGRHMQTLECKFLPKSKPCIFVNCLMGSRRLWPATHGKNWQNDENRMWKSNFVIKFPAERTERNQLICVVASACFLGHYCDIYGPS